MKFKRIHKSLFDEIMKESRLSHSPSFSFRCRKNAPEWRFAVVVPKKVSKKAVERNRSKRRVRGVLHELELENKPCHCIIFCKTGIEKKATDEMRNELNSFLGH